MVNVRAVTLRVIDYVSGLELHWRCTAKSVTRQELHWRCNTKRLNNTYLLAVMFVVVVVVAAAGEDIERRKPSGRLQLVPVLASSPAASCLQI